LNVTALIGIVSRTRAHILRLTRARIHDLVVSDWAARSVLRYWRLQRRGRRLLVAVGRGRVRPPLSMLAHTLVLSLGVALVIPVVTGRSVSAGSAVGEYSGYVLWISSTQARNAAQTREVTKASALEERPAPAAPDPAPRPAAVRHPVPPPATTFTPPPGSGGDGLAAIYAVFGSSPGLSWALRVANCESHYNPLAVNRYSGASGLFQFMPSTWNANFPGQNIWDPYAQARGALVFYNAGRQSAWTCK
jgi:Transglycosylase SLT domain